ncbi:Inosine-5'-monophosphate dehydrogenase [bioreactor metagenome]|jgi:CBS-domain-containing membrane protein|uniref:Inosine-5'-monophosphate dehydrogenase n=1 Tax=bioreactor metagenome TaxID=1076179 RepID=A0A644VBB2_9ZZZZ|nr:CBS domain-containing protein [Acidaminococcaceae bacterium]
MIVKELMSPEVLTISEDKSMLEARELMRSHNYRRIPVVDDIKRIRGIITDGDIGRSEPSDASTLSKYEASYLLSKLKVRDVMTKAVITVRETDGIEIAAYQLYKNKIGALPVVNDENKLCGIITDSDIFKAFVDIMGYAQTSTKLTIDTTDRIGVVADIAGIFKNRGINIISMVTRNVSNNHAEIVLRADLTNGLDIVEEIREAGFNITDISTLKAGQ